MSKNKYHVNRSVDLQLIISLTIVMVTILGSTIPLYIHSSSQIQAIHDEIRDFHVKLALQDQEFKNRMCKIEESRR